MNQLAGTIAVGLTIGVALLMIGGGMVMIGVAIADIISKLI